MAIVIVNIDDITFSINGINYIKNFVSVVSGDLVRIQNVYDSKLVLQVNANYADYTVGGASFGSAALLQAALVEVLYNRDLSGFESRIENLEQNQLTGVLYFSTKADMLAADATGQLNVAYKVISDGDTSLNGDYTSNGLIYTQQTFAVNGDISQGEVDAVKGGDIFDKFQNYATDVELLSNIQYKIKNGDKIDLLYGVNTGSYINSVGGLTPNASSEYSEFVYVRPLSDYRYIGKLIGNVLYIAYYDKDFNFISADSDAGTILDFQFTTPSNAYYIRYSVFDFLTTKSYILYEGTTEYKNENKDIKINRIEISASIDDLAAVPPIYSSIQAAYNSINDNSFFNRYVLEFLDGTHDADIILLKDYVSHKRSDKAVLNSPVIISHDFLNTQTVGERDLFQTKSNPYTTAAESFPLHVEFSDITFQGKNLNYCIHSDFNENPNIELIFNRCILNNNDPTTDVGASDYAAGIGIYGGQSIIFNDCSLNGRKIPIVDLPQYHQSSGWVIHNRADQIKNCNVTFNDCNHSGGYGGRIVDFGSGQNDSININGGVMNGTWGSLLMFNDAGVTTQSITVNCTAQLQRLQPQQEIITPGTRRESKIKVISSTTEVHKVLETINIGDVMTYSNKFGDGTNKTLSADTNNIILGVACGEAVNGDMLTIVKKGLVSAKIDTAVLININLTISDANNGSFKIAGVNDKVFAVTVNASTDTDNDEFNPNLTMINIL